MKLTTMTLKRLGLKSSASLEEVRSGITNLLAEIKRLKTAAGTNAAALAAANERAARAEAERNELLKLKGHQQHKAEDCTVAAANEIIGRTAAEQNIDVSTPEGWQRAFQAAKPRLAELSRNGKRNSVHESKASAEACAVAAANEIIGRTAAEQNIDVSTPEGWQRAFQAAKPRLAELSRGRV
jgi:hypothetical protein